MGLRTENVNDAWIRFKDGDLKIFTLIYSTYSHKLYQYGLKFTRQKPLVEDSIQDLFLELYKNRKTIGLTGNIAGYLFKSFRRKLFRRLNHEKRYDLRNEAEEYVFDVLYSFEHELILKEERERQMSLYQGTLKNLTARQKEAVYLKFTNGLKYEEISEIMEMTVESCRNLIWRAVKTLKDAILQGGNPAGDG